LNRRTGIGSAGFTAFLLVTAAIAAAAGGGVERMAVVFLINLIAVLGMGIYSGNSGILSFGHLAFMGLGAYASGILTMPVAMKKMTLSKLPAFLGSVQLDLLPAAVIAVVFVMLVALLVGIVISRLEGSAATIATLALLIIVHGLILGAREITRGSQSFFGVPRETGIWTACIAAVLAVILARVFRDSVPGLRLRASRDDLLAAGCVGVNVRRHRLLAWVVSAGVVALSGVLLAHFLGAFSAKKFYFVDTFMLLSMLIVGGMATVSGALAGTVLITLVTEVLRHTESGAGLFGMTQVGIGLIILIVMYRKSDGLLGHREWDEMLIKAPFAPPAPEEPAGDGDALVEARDVSRSFSGLLALDKVSLDMRCGEILGLIGPNGSGKTTLLNILSGVLPPSSGEILVDGRSVNGMPSHVVAGLGVGRTFQNIRLFTSFTVRQNVLIAALNRWPSVPRARAEAIAQRAIIAMGLKGKAHAFAANLSYGDQRRVEIARALALEPAFLFLDEPAAGMNREETDSLLEDLRRLKQSRRMGILIIDHDLPLIMRLCDRVVVLNEGRLIAHGTPAEVQRDEAVIEAYMGRRCKIVEDAK